MRSLLIVDDEYYIRVRVKKCVDWLALGFETVVECENGRDALALMDERPFDLVILDISMPVMDGLALCREMHEKGHRTQVIFLTGYDKFEYAKTALAYGVVDYILKPVDGEEMEKAVRKALGRMALSASIEHQMRKSEELERETKRMKTDLLFGAILSGGCLENAAVAAQMESHGIRPDARYSVMYFQAGDLPSFAALLPTGIFGLEVRLAQGRVWIVEEAQPGDTVKYLSENQLLPDAPFGVSLSRGGTPKQVHAAYQEAVRNFPQDRVTASDAGMLLVKRVRQLVEEHYMEEDLSLSTIAQTLCLNASYLSDSFRRFGGQTLSQYITQVRMEKASELLRRGNTGLVDLMEQVGYKDPYYFSKRFKKYFGCSPTAYGAK